MYAHIPTTIRPSLETYNSAITIIIIIVSTRIYIYVYITYIQLVGNRLIADNYKIMMEKSLLAKHDNIRTRVNRK